MPFNGAGMFVRLRNWVEDATAGVKIRADYHDSEDDNFAGGISQCIARDGQSTVLANIPMNGKRIVSLADPVDPQDVSTKAYTDTKMPLAGGTMNGSLEVIGSVAAIGYKTRKGLPGPYGTQFFNFEWTGSFLNAWVDNTSTGTLATTAYVEQRASDWAHAVADPKVNRAGDTMTGGLTVNGELVAAAAYIRFQYSGSGGYLQWNGGGTYTFGSGGTAWHTGNLNPIQDGRLVNAGDFVGPQFGNQVTAGIFEPRGGAVVTGLYFVGGDASATGSLAICVRGGRWRYMQLLTPGGWYTVGYA